MRKKIVYKKEEMLINEYRAHPSTMFFGWLFGILLIAISFFLMFWLFRQGFWGQIVFASVVLCGILVIAVTVIRWRRNVAIVTSHKVVDIYSRRLFDTIISELPYDQIIDVSGRVKGVFGTIFRYGDVNIHAGGGQIMVNIKKVKSPTVLQHLINDCREKYIRDVLNAPDKLSLKLILENLEKMDSDELKQIEFGIENCREKL